MRSLAFSTQVLILAVALAGCQAQMPSPKDLRAKMLDIRTAAQESDLVVLAYPVSQRDLRRLAAPVANQPESLRLAETETTLRVLRVLKGPRLPSEIRFHYYDARGYTQVGPPQGPSGHMGSRGIFFLNIRSDGSFRSAVDVYRPDIPMPWLMGTGESEVCAEVAGCIAGLLLRFREADNAESFASRLVVNVSIARQLTGVFGTFDLLNALAGMQVLPDVVRRGVCTEMASWYPLEMPSRCRTVIVGTPAEKRYLVQLAKLREALRSGGVRWIHDQIATNDADDEERYLNLLSSSADEQVRELANDLENRGPRQKEPRGQATKPRNR
jgi:hypothetical protein